MDRRSEAANQSKHPGPKPRLRVNQSHAGAGDLKTSKAAREPARQSRAPKSKSH